MTTEPWPHAPVPGTDGTGKQWQVSSPAQLHHLRADLRAHLRSCACDRDEAEPVSERILMVVDELTSNGLRHGLPPVTTRVVATFDSWLIVITDLCTGQHPQLAVGRDRALGGMGLQLVADLTSARGWTLSDGDKHVWALIPAV
jgi:anti-sigma regulatory factor (Ser/Thr protein kinase)